MQADGPGYMSMAEGNRRRAEALAQRMEQMRPLVEALDQLGWRVSTPEELYQGRPISEEVVALLFEWLAREDIDPAIHGSILIGLFKPAKRYDGAPLIDFWNKSKSEAVKWEIGYTVAKAKPRGLSEWVIQELLDRSNGTGREWLCLAAAKLAPAEVASQAIMAVFDDVPESVRHGTAYNGLPEFAAQALGMIGGRSERRFLETKLDATQGRAKKEIEKAIRKIDRRLTKNGASV